MCTFIKKENNSLFVPSNLLVRTEVWFINCDITTRSEFSVSIEERVVGIARKTILLKYSITQFSPFMSKEVAFKCKIIIVEKRKFAACCLLTRWSKSWCNKTIDLQRKVRCDVNILSSLPTSASLDRVWVVLIQRVGGVNSDHTILQCKRHKLNITEYALFFN